MAESRAGNTVRDSLEERPQRLSYRSGADGQVRSLPGNSTALACLVRMFSAPRYVISGWRAAILTIASRIGSHRFSDVDERPDILAARSAD